MPEITNHQGTRFKTTKRGHVTPLGWLLPHTHTHTEDDKRWRVWGNWSLVRCGGMQDVQKLGTPSRRCLEPYTELPSDPATPLWAQNQVRGRQELRYLHTCAHSSTTDNSPRLHPPTDLICKQTPHSLRPAGEPGSRQGSLEADFHQPSLRQREPSGRGRRHLLLGWSTGFPSQ